MIDIYKLLNYLGIAVSSESSPIVLVLASILILSSVALLSFINIGIYLFSLHLSNNKWLLDKVSNSRILLKLLNIYKKTRIGFIVFEVTLFLVSQSNIIWFCFKCIPLI